MHSIYYRAEINLSSVKMERFNTQSGDWNIVSEYHMASSSQPLPLALCCLVSQSQIMVMVSVSMLVLAALLPSLLSASPLQNWYSTPFSWVYQNDIFAKAASKNKLSEKMVTGR